MIVGLIVHYESTMSSYFPLRYYVNTYNYLNPFRAKVQYTGPSARLSRDRLPCDSPIEATTPF